MMACPVCHRLYSVGVVGTGVVGGHDCPVRSALVRIVDLYRHPDSGRMIVEPGSSDMDDALIEALEALGES